MPTIPQSGVKAKTDENGNLTIFVGAENTSVTVQWASGVTAGFIRGVTDTDRTGLMLRSPNGTLKYIVVADDNTVSASATAP